MCPCCRGEAGRHRARRVVPKGPGRRAVGAAGAGFQRTGKARPGRGGAGAGRGILSLVSRKRGNVGHHALMLGAALFSLLVGIDAMGYWNTAAGWGLVALWAITAAVVLTLHLDRNAGEALPRLRPDRAAYWMCPRCRGVAGRHRAGRVDAQVATDEQWSCWSRCPTCRRNGRQARGDLGRWLAKRSARLGHRGGVLAHPRSELRPDQSSIATSTPVPSIKPLRPTDRPRQIHLRSVRVCDRSEPGAGAQFGTNGGAAYGARMDPVGMHAHASCQNEVRVTATDYDALRRPTRRERSSLFSGITRGPRCSPSPARSPGRGASTRGAVLGRWRRTADSAPSSPAST